MAKEAMSTSPQNSADEKIKILLLLGAPFTEQNYERIGIPHLEENFSLIVFQCMEWLDRPFGAEFFEPKKWEPYEFIRSEDDFRDLLRKHRPEYAIDFIGFGLITPKIARILRSQNVKLVIQKLGTLPCDREMYARLKRLFKSKLRVNFLKKRTKSTTLELMYDRKKMRVSKVNQNRLGLNLVRRVLPLNLRLSTPFIALLAGKKSNSTLTRMAKKTVWCASNDFNTFQKINTCKSTNLPRDYFVFLDDCLTQGLDWFTLNMNAPVTPELYFSHLNNYFQKVEKEYSLPVVIAGHPNTANDNSYSKNFNGREIFYGKTAELVLHSRSVLVHASASVSYAILSKKPITSITTEELDSSHYGNWIRSVSRAVGSKMVFIDKNLGEGTMSIQPNAQKYLSYELNFLRSKQSKETNPWESFTEFVLENRKGK
jgi:hypothetical protein